MKSHQHKRALVLGWLYIDTHERYWIPMDWHEKEERFPFKTLDSLAYHKLIEVHSGGMGWRPLRETYYVFEQWEDRNFKRYHLWKDRVEEYLACAPALVEKPTSNEMIAKAKRAYELYRSMSFSVRLMAYRIAQNRGIPTPHDYETVPRTDENRIL